MNLLNGRKCAQGGIYGTLISELENAKKKFNL